MERQNVQDPQGRGAGARQEDRGQKWMDSGLLLKAGMMGRGLGWMELGRERRAQDDLWCGGPEKGSGKASAPEVWPRGGLRLMREGVRELWTHRPCSP